MYFFQMEAIAFSNPSGSINMNYPNEVSYSKFEIDRLYNKYQYWIAIFDFTHAIHMWSL